MTKTEADKPTRASELFSSPTTDVILLSLDGVAFSAHRVFLMEASPVFREMLSTLQPGAEHESRSLPSLDLSEIEEIVDGLLRWIYPCPNKPATDTWELLESYFEAAWKYRVDVAITALQERLNVFVHRAKSKSTPVRAYGLCLWLRDTCGLDAPDLLTLARKSIIRTDTNLLQMDAVTLKRLTAMDVVNLTNAQAAYRRRVDRILSFPKSWTFSYRCSQHTSKEDRMPPWWRAFRSHLLTKAKNRTAQDPLFSSSFLASWTELVTCLDCRGQLTCAESEFRRMDKELLVLWETGTGGDLVCWEIKKAV
ncbi:hypothetical protein BOTBODRAFT_188703 [Botryobasidium botryosum FD-172 SS1]|uniref:BTB domain-containing protein n=1 Tax=Botryobasidium botryosum (strain FD-172 SS1) TaxID=930990 RepID=A0A067MMR6_BOTB1|nr:hypothetical protein BOTBODRAFT_188703 [Botryobasidium botryosum FD-172 SS1]